MIEIKNLTYVANNKKILDSVNMTARNGEITVLVGNNGSGKTTLLRSVAAYCEHRRNITGEIFIDGTDISTISPAGIIARLSLLPQTLPIPKITVRELVSLGRASQKSPFARETATDRACAERAISDMGLSRLADAPLGQISGGERQAAYFAMILAKDTNNLLLDEPTSALDSENRALLFSFLEKMREQGRCVLAVLHDLTDATAIADRITVISGGRAVFHGTPDELRISGIPERLFGITACQAEADGKKRIVYLSRPK